ncbi:MAG: pyridoxal phosphate-dependent aminotransferase [Kiritimatiellae bacterium]|jgi:aspartate aminotransferase|nr:pyridoxal phosphate-dependent aminotransferase [Kiritimatiellia bacterium]
MNKNITSIAPSITLAITGKAKQMVAEGKNIYSFAAGEPDFDTPDFIKKAAEKALDAGETKYTPATGLLSFREAISKKLKDENGLEYAASQIVVSNGAKHSLFNVMMTLCNVGDEIIIPAPFWLSYPEMVTMAGGTPVFVHSKEENDYKMTAEEFKAAITSKSKAVVLNSPSNPIGCVYTKEELEKIAEIAVANDLYIISDEIYEKLIYDGMKHFSIGSTSEATLRKTITINGFSKSCSMTGWRLGYAALPVEMVKPVSALQSHSTSGPNTFAQYGGLAALTDGEDPLATMYPAFVQRREKMFKLLSEIPGVTCIKPMGSFYMFPNISSTGLDSVTFSERLLEEQNVAVVPGAAFAADSNVRLSYACSMETIEQGIAHIRKFLENI